jgi:histidinol dehydrogenase
LHLAGATEIYRVGGSQAIAALALGTETIRPVLKIFGPGNAYVVEAKRQVFGRVAVDLLPGPSEVLVMGDASSQPAWIAADLLAQCEHGHGSAALMVTDSEDLLAAVEAEVLAQTQLSQRPKELEKALKNVVLVLVSDRDAMVRVANDYAAEHVSIATKDPGDIALRLRTSGAIFLGGLSPVAAGDFLAGPSHELPTGGAGKSFAGLTVDQFQRRTSVVMFDQKSLAASAPTIDVFSRIEGLDAHGRSVSVRLQP